MPYALTLGIYAGLMAIVPYLGPLLGALPSVLIALTISPWMALFTLILYFVVIQFFESNFITPLIMGRATGLNPITVIIVLLIGGQLYGMLGIILAVPVTTALKVFAKDIRERERRAIKT
jgi:predicted PurR-regulated permease PerM